MKARAANKDGPSSGIAVNAKAVSKPPSSGINERPRTSSVQLPPVIATPMNPTHPLAIQRSSTLSEAKEISTAAAMLSQKRRTPPSSTVGVFFGSDNASGTRCIPSRRCGVCLPCFRPQRWPFASESKKEMNVT